jgi:hypothetical protein
MDNKSVVEYRARLLEQLLKSSEAFCAACRATRDLRKPLDKNGWNVHQLAEHVRDVQEQSYGLRVRRTLAEAEPLFPKFHADRWAAEHYDPDEPLEKILDEFMENIRSLDADLRTRPDSAWSRIGRHEIQGARTLQIWVERSLEHVREHLETVKKAGSAG